MLSRRLPRTTRSGLIHLTLNRTLNTKCDTRPLTALHSRSCRNDGVTTSSGCLGPQLRHPTAISSPVARWRVEQRRGKRTKVVVDLDDLPGGPTEAKPARKKRTKKAVDLEDLPQGPLEADPLAIEPEDEDEGPSYPTVVLQAKRNMEKFDNCVLLTRVGGFYELYFEHADEYGPLLNLKVAEKKTSAGPVPMAGFPFFQLDRFLKILVQDLNRYVAIAEEFPNNASEKVKSGGLMHDRRVARIITPGTLIDENFMDPYASNYVMALYLPEPEQQEVKVSEEASGEEDHGIVTNPSANQLCAPLGLAWLDLSTGQFFTQISTLASLSTILSRVCPREIILDKDLEFQKDHDIFSVLAEERHLITFAPLDETPSLENWLPMLESAIPEQLAGEFTTEEVSAGSILLHYVRDRLQGLNMKLQAPLRYESMQVMNIDRNSMRALEIKQTIRDGAFRGSLLHAIRRTVTKSGARLLNEWLSAPSTSLDVINARQELVARFIEEEELRENITVLLKRSHDSQRLVQKFALGRGAPDDLLDLAKTIKATEDIVYLLKECTVSRSAFDENEGDIENDCLKVLTDRISLDQTLALAKRIRDSVDEEGLVQQHEIENSEAGEVIALAREIVETQGSPEDGAVLPKKATSKKRDKGPSLRDFYGADNEAWIMKPGASRTLTRLHADLASLIDERTTLASTLQQRFDAPSLTLKWTPGLGHICHIKGKDTRTFAASASTADIRTLSSSRSTRSFHLPEWTALGQRLDQARLHIRAEEQRVFTSLREDVVLNLVRLRRNAAVLDELDIATSFARLAREHALTRPILRGGTCTSHKILGGRHPTVEGGLAEQGRTFTTNSCLVGAPGHGRAWLITGPNMAGKSTFLRQNALITVLAQIGCYVPADYAELGIVDAVFSRVGSADNLYRDQSTFMVEMLETAAILRAATPRSFVIMDEIGRGTTPEDGTAVAFATLHHLVHVNKCRTLFATHFHGLADLAAKEKMTVEDGGEAGTVEMYCTDVDEDADGGFVYVHKLRKGVNRRSHALKVAGIAGLPGKAIDTAKRVLEGTIGK